MYAIQLYNFNLMKYAIQLYNFNLMKSINSQITKNCGIFLLALLHLLWWLKNLCCRSRNLENYHNEGFEWSFPTFRSQIFFLPGIRTFWNMTFHQNGNYLWTSRSKRRPAILLLTISDSCSLMAPGDLLFWKVKFMCCSSFSLWYLWLSLIIDNRIHSE